MHASDHGGGLSDGTDRPARKGMLAREYQTLPSKGEKSILDTQTGGGPGESGPPSITLPVSGVDEPGATTVRKSCSVGESSGVACKLEIVLLY